MWYCEKPKKKGAELYEGDLRSEYGRKVVSKRQRNVRRTKTGQEGPDTHLGGCEAERGSQLQPRQLKTRRTSRITLLVLEEHLVHDVGTERLGGGEEDTCIEKLLSAVPKSSETSDEGRKSEPWKTRQVMKAPACARTSVKGRPRAKERAGTNRKSWCSLPRRA